MAAAIHGQYHGPGGFSGLVPTSGVGDPNSLTLSDTVPQPANARLRDFQIPGKNPRGVDGSTLGFLFSIPQTVGTPLFTARVVDPTALDWYRHITPWEFDLHTPRPQRGGVQILSNVINPDKGEVTTLQYTLGTDGSVTIMVFDLSGSIITVLQQGHPGRR